MRNFLILIFALLAILTTIIIAYVIQHRPSYEGNIELKNLEAEVEVVFDEFGIPHIYAENESDLYRAFGYIHAQERLFQMDLLRRVGSGRLSELIGKDALKVDLFFRTLGITEVAKRDAQRLRESDTPASRAALAYIDGINQFIEMGYSPVEYTLLGEDPVLFEAEDIFNALGYMSFSFAQAQRTEPLVQYIYNKLGMEYLKELDMDGSKNPQLIYNHVPDKDSIENISRNLTALMESLPVQPFIGSNSWVLSPSKTKSGKVILANDPHIGFAQPAVWYEAYLESGDFRFYGYHIAGVPFGIIGHNPEVAWGLTMFENDDIDLFSEKINPEDEMQVWVNDHWENMKIREEIITIKDSEDTTLIVRETRHGPVINDVLDTKLKKAVSMFWVYTQYDNSIIDILFSMGRAHGINEMEQLVSGIHAPGLNVMYGDNKGNVAWWATGKLLKRPEHVNSKMILDGASGKDEYLGYYDFSYNPKAVNPPWGYVYSANNRPDSLNGVHIPGYYLPEDRARRIVDLLESREKWEVTEVMEMMNDVTSAVAVELKDEILKVLQNDTEVQTDQYSSVFEALKNWNGTYDKESVGAIIYSKLLYEIQYLTYADELGSRVFNDFIAIHLAKRSIAPLIKNDSSIWYDNLETETKEERKDIFKTAIKNTITQLIEQLGTDLTDWKWQDVHSLEHVHPIGRKEPMDKFFNVGPFPVGGSNEVINNLMFDLNGKGVYKVKAGPSKRRIVDFSNIESTYSILPTGQSGNVLSKHYMDQAELYNQGKFRKQRMNREAVLKYKESVLTFIPSEN